jgi:hypothetical protein
MNKFLYTIFLSLAILVFLVLAWKKPYGTNSLIGNFDPFPDSLHYVVPARNFALGQGFTFAREGLELKIGVPPVYSLSLIPIYLLNQDARSFYFINLILGIISIILLFKISRQLSKSVWVTGLLLFVYVSSFVIYWQPSLAMAENVLLPVCLGALWLAIQPLSKANIFASTILAVACYGSKYVSLPITGVFILFLLWRINTEIKRPQAIKLSLAVIALSSFTFALLNGYQFFTYLTNFLQSNLGVVPEIEQKTAWLSLQYFSQSFPQYSAALMGGSIYNLWYNKPILPIGLAAVVLIWCLYALFKLPKQRKLASLILSLVAAQLGLLSIIEMIEGRYAFAFIPIILTAAAAMAGWLVRQVEQKFGSKKTELMQIIAVGLLATIFFLSNFSDLKRQLLLNFKGGEMPWWQVGIQATDSFMLTKQTDSKTLLVSSLSPFVWDFYRQADYEILTFASGQANYYKQELSKGRQIYLTTVGFGHNDWPILAEYINSDLELELLREDCVGACKLYGVTRKSVIQ